MMRRTAACAGLALALYLSAWLPLDSKPSEVVQALSLEDIDVVVLQGNPAQVTFTVGAPKALYNPSEMPRLLERRKGRVLVLYPPERSRSSYEVQLRPGLRRLVVPGTSVMVEKGVIMPSLELRTGSDLQWRGDIARLDIIDTDAHVRDKDCAYCGSEITIFESKIGVLRVSTLASGVAIQAPDDVGRTTLFLGDGARYSLGMATRQAQLQLLPWRAGIIEATPQESAPQ